MLVEDARAFVERLRKASGNPVVYAELPKAQHAFDLFHSIRFETLVNAIEAFATWVRSRPRLESTRATNGRRPIADDLVLSTLAGFATLESRASDTSAGASHH